MTVVKEVGDVVRALQRAKRPLDAAPWGGVIFLIGAGASASAGIPLAKGIAEQIAVKLAGKYSNGSFDSDDPEEALAWLRQEGHIPSSLSWASAYAYFFEYHTRDPAEQRELIRAAVGRGSGAINWAHLCLGELVRQHYVHTVLTTNFDQLILDGLIRCGLIPVVADGIESLDRIDGDPVQPQIVHLHGSQHTYRLRNSTGAVAATQTDLRTIRALAELLRLAPALVVVGYAGHEEGIMNLLSEAVRSLGEKTLFWVSYGTTLTDLSEESRALMTQAANGGILLRQDADAFFAALMKGLGIGVPIWMSTPVSFLSSRARLIYTPSDRSDVQQLLVRYTNELTTLDRLLLENRKNDEISQLCAEALNLRLADRLHEALGLLASATTRLDDPRLLRLLAEVHRDIGYFDTEHCRQSVETYGRLLATILPEDKRERAGIVRDMAWVQEMWGNRIGSEEILQKALGAYDEAYAIFRTVGLPSDIVGVTLGAARALARMSALRGDRGLLEAANDRLGSALADCSRQQHPVEWVALQNQLGITLSGLAVSDAGEEMLLRAEAAFQAAAQRALEADVQIDMARILANLGNVYVRLGERRGAPESVRQGIRAYEEAIAISGPETDRLDIANARNNRGLALARLSALTGDAVHLTEALSDFDEAESLVGSDESPLLFNIKLNRGCCIMQRAALHGGVDDPQQAVTIFSGLIRDEARVLWPVAWALAKANLGEAWLAIAERTNDATLARNAIGEAEAALSVLSSQGGSGKALAESTIARARTWLVRHGS